MAENSRKEKGRKRKKPERDLSNVYKMNPYLPTNQNGELRRTEQKVWGISVLCLFKSVIKVVSGKDAGSAIGRRQVYSVAVTNCEKYVTLEDKCLPNGI